MEIKINKEVNSFEPKVIGPFTIRQAVCVFLAVPICLWFYKKGSAFLPSDIVDFLLLIPAAITWLFGWKKPYGMPMEKFLKSIFVNVILASGNRIYKTEKQLSFADTELRREQKTSLHKAKKSPTYKRSPDGVE